MNPSDEGRALRIAASVEPLERGHFSLNLSPFYTVMGHPHGGYLQCVMASAALAAASEAGATHLHVTSISTNFVKVLEVGAADIRTEVRRVGRGASFVYAALYQEGVLGAESLVTLGTLHEGSLLRYQDLEAPHVTPLEECRQSTGATTSTSSAYSSCDSTPRAPAGGVVSFPHGARSWVGYVWTMATRRGPRGVSCSRVTRCLRRRSHWARRVGSPRCS